MFVYTKHRYFRDSNLQTLVKVGVHYIDLKWLFYNSPAQDPDVMAAFQDVSQNPANISKYENNPKVKQVIDKLSTKFGPPQPSEN